MNNNFKNNDNDVIFEINSDINGNEELYLLEKGNVSPSKSDENKEYRLSSTVDNFLDSNCEYQFCFMDDDDDDIDDLEIELSPSDQEGIDSKEVNIDQMEVIVSEDVSVSGQCTAGPTVHCHQEQLLSVFTTNNDEDDSEGSDLAYIVLCENYVRELRYGRIEDEFHGYQKDRAKIAIGRWDDVVKYYGRFPMNSYEISSVFKVNHGFEEGGRFLEDFCDLNDLH